MADFRTWSSEIPVFIIRGCLKLRGSEYFTSTPAQEVVGKLLQLCEQRLSLALDAARIGKPGLELYLLAASDTRTMKHCILPPQARLARTLASHVAILSHKRCLCVALNGLGHFRARWRDSL